MDDRLAAVLAWEFPDREVERSGDAGPSWNEKNETLGVAFTDGEVVFVKLAVDDDSSRIRRERAVIDHVAANTTVTVPEDLASDTDADTPYLVTAKVDGDLLHRVSDGWTLDPALARMAGRTLARVHATRFETHGRIVDGDAGGLDIDPMPWADLLTEQIADQRDLAPDGRFDHHFDDVQSLIEANRDLLDTAPAALAHGDPAQPNAFRTDDGVGLLDWELAHAGDPARELIRARRQLTEPLHGEGDPEPIDALYAGYEAEAGGLPEGFDARQPLYEAVTFLGVSGFFEKWVGMADGEEDELAAWTRAEMERRLAAARSVTE